MSSLSKSAKLKRLKGQIYRCGYCAVHITDNVKSELDHVVPASRGGSDCKENRLVVCLKCNRAKRNMLLGEFKKKLNVKDFWFELIFLERGAINYCGFVLVDPYTLEPR